MTTLSWSIIEQRIENLAPEACKISDWMAAHPELSEEEFEAVQRHGAYLRAAGFSVTAPYCDLPTSYDAMLHGIGPGPCVALMAEYDALPELGHACGHNVHGAMALLAGAALAPEMTHLPGRLRIVGTPAEETLGQKATMTNRGAFDDVDLALMIHCEGGQSYVRYRALAVRSYQFTFTGRTTHAAASPWEGVNALNALRLFYDALDMRRQHLRPEVRIHGVITHGGVYANIVPEKAVAQFHFRAPDRTMLEDLVRQALECAQGAAMAAGASVEWELFEEPFEEIKPNAAAEDMLEELFIEFNAPSLKKAPPAQDSTDVGAVSWKCPAFQPVLDITDGQIMTLHSREFAAFCASPASHRSIVRGAKILAKAAWRVLTDADLARRIKEEFNQ